MAKLTEVDKAANKAAKQVRDKAFRLRNNQYSEAQAAARARVAASPEAKAVDDANAALTKGLERRDQERNAILTKIAALNDDLTRLEDQFRQKLDAINGVRKLTWKLQDVVEKTEAAKIKSAFPDVDDLPFVGAWAIPETVQQAMDAAAAHARKTFVPDTKKSGKGPAC